LPTVRALIDLVGIRNTLRAENLYDTCVPQEFWGKAPENSAGVIVRLEVAAPGA